LGSTGGDALVDLFQNLEGVRKFVFAATPFYFEFDRLARSRQQIDRILRSCHRFEGILLSLNYALKEGEDLQKILVDFDREFAGLISEVLFEATKPPAINMLVRFLEDSERTYDWRYLKAFASGAWPIAESLIEKLKKVAAEKCNNPNLQHNQVWGMTEASPMVTTNPLLRLDKSYTQGIPLPDVELKIIDLETGKELGINQSGEIVIRGPQIMKGYWKRGKENRDAGGTTRRAGSSSEPETSVTSTTRGFLHFQDRVKEVIKYKGYTIAPFELESLLMRHEAVMDVAVVGKPDAEAGEIPKALSY